MASTGNPALALCLAALSLAVTASAVTTVEVSSAMPAGPLALDVRCGDNGGTNRQEVRLSPGGRADFTPMSTTGLPEPYYCVAMWNSKSASWKGYDPSRDQAHTSVFWQARLDGLYLSYDKASWVKSGHWV